jgi:hypothetical protein
MTVNRVSTSLVRFFGAGVKAQQAGGKLSNLVSDGQGGETPMAADVQRFLTKGLTPASVNIHDYQSALGHLERLGASPLAAKAMALVFVDAAKAQGVSVMSLIESTNSSQLSLLSAETYKYINQLRDSTNQLSGSVAVDNSLSLRSRYLIP